MPTLVDDLGRIESALNEIDRKTGTPKLHACLKELATAVEGVQKSFCGSWLGYHACVYYQGLQPRPPGAHFSSEWGLGYETTGDWAEFDGPQVLEHLKDQAQSLTFDQLKAIATNAAEQAREYREELLSIVDACLSRNEDQYLTKLKTHAEAARVRGASETIKQYMPSGQLFSRDMVAITAGLKPPPHYELQAQLDVIESCLNMPSSLATIAKRIAAHLGKKEQTKGIASKQGNKVFLGHGGSEAWRQLKDFIEDTLGLEVDEFNQKPVAGMTNITRLSEMLDDAAIAFLVMTAEDEQKDGTKHARMNVIHEAGLFQGRLGFTRAIVVLEEGCEEFSNIQGLGQIRFPPKKIKSAFQEVREVLERENLI